jgi:hypothetical protein
MSALIQVTQDRRLIFPDVTVSMRDQALEQAALIARVTNAEENDTAIGAQKALKEFCSLMERGRVAAKAPAIEEGRSIDKSVAEFVDVAKQELIRIEMITSNFAALELAKQRAAQAAENKRLLEIERQREAELSKATTLEAHQAIREAYVEKVLAAQTPSVAPIRAEGQQIREEWEIVNIQDFVLYSRRPDLATSINWNKRAIKHELDRGVTLPGVEAKAVVKVVVMSKPSKAIEV